MCVGKDDADLARRAAAIGRPLDDLRRTGIAGTPGEVVDKLGAFASIGVSRVYLQTLDLDDLDHLELVANEVLAQV
jgi:alkanesulfonate monooxygenase SsuD/methylene tetrahydromethanopterin reductase-like flavin-dependent oxidoreductase (luciferase family)